jgi:hypothetical protein
VAVEGVVEGGGIRGAGHRRERPGDERAVRLLEGELGRALSVRDAEAVEHLGDEEIVGRQPA